MTIKEKIKILSEEQKVYKNQRKTVNLVGERIMPTWEAANKHMNNRFTLMHMFIAYGLSRGKTIDQICPNTKELVFEDIIKKIQDEYNLQAKMQEEA